MNQHEKLQCKLHNVGDDDGVALSRRLTEGMLLVLLGINDGTPLGAVEGMSLLLIEEGEEEEEEEEELDRIMVDGEAVKPFGQVEAEAACRHVTLHPPPSKHMDPMSSRATLLEGSPHVPVS
mmetsp:Transcript_23669/g.40147  ORF Transcript_23669/g.40147 Transcript_23669/m.40147 type:complete len:122 (+) Transcript_23669:27-392(+)